MHHSISAVLKLSPCCPPGVGGGGGGNVEGGLGTGWQDQLRLVWSVLYGNGKRGMRLENRGNE